MTTYLGIKIEVEEIENGYIIKFYTENGPSKLDKTIHVNTWKETLYQIDNWKEETEHQTNNNQQPSTQTKQAIDY